MVGAWIVCNNADMAIECKLADNNGSLLGGAADYVEKSVVLIE